MNADNPLPLDLSLLPREERVLVACSGGADSLALLLALREAEFSLVAAHVNHGTRGAQSDDDENFVRQTCENWIVPFGSARLHLENNANEAVLRDARYAALLALARQYSCPRVATAHTASDNLETILLNWLRGASVSGLAGIATQRALGEGVLVVRPLLNATGEMTRDYLRTRGVSWREDASNADARFLRNRVRHELLPKLRELGADENRLARQTLEAARIWRDDVAYLTAAAQTQLSESTLHEETGLLILDGLRFRALPTALQRRVLRLAAARIIPESRDLEVARIEEVRLAVMENRRRAVWQWRGDLRVEWTGEYSGNRIRFRCV